MITRASDGRRLVLDTAGLAALLASLRATGYRLMGPTVRGGAIVHAEIEGFDDLPVGWTEVQDAGTYRLARREDPAVFGYSVGPQSWKQEFFVPRLRLWRARRKDGRFVVEADADSANARGTGENDHSVRRPSKLALIGARSCDLHAISVQDRTFMQGPFIDPDYAARRQDVFVLAVHCGQAGGTCFCASMNTGPKATFGFDLALTELFDPHRFVVEIGTEQGEQALDRVEHRIATDADVESADAIVEDTATQMGRRLDTSDIKELLYRNLEHPRWDDVAERCLACTNCTLACPTCFCSSVEDLSDLQGETAERWRRWDSCFTLDHSYLHGGSVRPSVRSRYRQWLTHKLASWIDQFGVSGCVGCGRCITWCPVGIDLTEEVAAIRATDEACSGCRQGEDGA